MGTGTTTPEEHENDAHAARSHAWSRSVKVLNFILAQWLVIGFGLGCLFGYLFPHVAAPGGIIKSEISILYGAIALIFLVSGLQLPQDKLRQQAANWRLHIVVQGISFIVIPVIELILIRIIITAGGVRNGTIDASVIIGMLVVSCCPTTIASNVVMTRAAGGDDAAAITEVVIGNVLGSFIAPGLIYGFFPSESEFDRWRPATSSSLGPMYAGVMKQLGLSVLLPLATGQLIRCFFLKQVKWALEKFYLVKISAFCLILLVWATFSGAFETGALYIIPKSSIIFNIFNNVALYMVVTMCCFWTANPPDKFARPLNRLVADSRAVSNLPKLFKSALTVKAMPMAETVAVCFCGAAKTQSVGIPLVDAMWKQHDSLTRSLIQIPVLLYTMEQVFVAQLLVYVFKRWIQNGQKRARNAESMASEDDALQSRVNTEAGGEG